MATISTNHVQLNTLLSIDTVDKFRRSLDDLRALLDGADFQILAPGTNLQTLTSAGTVQDGIVAENTAITASTYAITAAAKTLTFKKWLAKTSIEEIARRGYEAAVSATDDKLVKDVQKILVGDIFTGISTGATGTAAGVGLQATCADAWAALGTACENESATPVFFVGYDAAADWLASSNVVPSGNLWGLRVFKDWMGLGTLIISSQVPANTVWCTAMENLVIAAADVSGITDFGLVQDELGIFAVGHEGEKDTASVDTFVYSGLSVFPLYADRFIVGTIS